MAGGEAGRGRTDTSGLREDYLELAGMSDEAVEKATGRRWAEWTAFLDEHAAARLEHAAIAELVSGEGASPWWSQTVTVAYERFRGLREPGQRRGGGFDVNKSRTVQVSHERLFAAWEPDARSEWLDVPLEDSTVSPPNSRRMKTPDGTTVALWFTEKGPEKCAVSVQVEGLPDGEAADTVRSEWHERLDRLVEWVRAEVGPGRERRKQVPRPRRSRAHPPGRRPDQFPLGGSSVG
jgi:hypothetical protein